MELNENLAQLRLSGIRRFTALAKEVGNCVMLTLGEPEFDTPKPIIDACKKALDDGCTHYTENRGDAGLRTAISAFEAKKRGLSYCPDEIIITAGATEAIYTAMMGVLNPSDEVIIPVPAFSLYDTIAKLCGAKVVSVHTADDGFQLTKDRLEKAITSKTKLLILNSPNNPTGVIYSKDNLEGIRELAKKHGFFVLSDDVYWGLSPCTTFSQFHDLKDQILSVQSFSKPYAMTGWRIGYLMTSSSLAGKLTALHGHLLTCAPAMLQRACMTALDVDPAPMAQSYKARRDYVCRRLTEMGLPFHTPQGAFYIFPSISHLGLSSDEFCTRLIREGHVATVPGSVFGCEGFFRMSYCCSQEELEEGLNRLEVFLSTIK